MVSDVETPQRRGTLRWWREVLYVLIFYGIYSAVRNQFGSNAVGPREALRNAEHVIRIEEAVGLFREQALQSAFLGWSWFIRWWNIYYGTFHFVVTACALIWMYRAFPERYPRWRSTLAAMTGLALLGFATFPLMPPRLLNVPTSTPAPATQLHADLSQEPSPYGGGAYADEQYGFVDTLDQVGGLWSFDSGAMQTVSNQYAAMPSLHIGWSTWCAFVLIPQLRRRWAKVLAGLYPVITLFCIMVTANHFWFDGVGGLVVFGVGLAIGTAVARLTRQADGEDRAAAGGDEGGDDGEGHSWGSGDEVDLPAR